MKLAPPNLECKLAKATAEKREMVSQGKGGKLILARMRTNPVKMDVQKLNSIES